MNSKDNRGALILLSVIAVGGILYLGLNLFWWPLQEANQQAEQLEKANRDKSLQIAQIVKDKSWLARQRSLSLPAPDTKVIKPKGPAAPAQERDIPHIQDQYVTYLRDLVNKHGLTLTAFPKPAGVDTTSAPKVAGPTPAYTSLSFNLTAKGQMKGIAKMLQEFQTTPLLQRAKNLTIRHAEGKDGPLVLTMTAEALIVNGSTNLGNSRTLLNLPVVAVDVTRPYAAAVAAVVGKHPFVEIAASGTAFAPRRNYADLAVNNVFEGGKRYDPTEYRPPPPPKDKPPPLPDVISFAFLTDVTITPDKGTRASVYDRMWERKLDLRVSAGYNWIPLLKDSESNTLVRGKVLNIDTRGIAFHVEMQARSPE
ncbi:MAG TPA: hypothetical protein VEL76_41675, partial [Gemmataceae bacterium]|nr:hypothetical protein [Gemmataceae bacterium]